MLDDLRNMVVMDPNVVELSDEDLYARQCMQWKFKPLSSTKLKKRVPGAP